MIALSEKKGIPIFSYESANHSLETGDALECLEILTDVMTKTKAFLCKKNWEVKREKTHKIGAVHCTPAVPVV